MKPNPDRAEYLIWSIEHQAWWKPNELGYTLFPAEAGRYSLQKAWEICQQANGSLKGTAESSGHPQEAIVPVPVP